MSKDRSAGIFRIVHPSPVALPPEWTGEKRKAPRPPEFRPGSYMEKFDAETLWYDIFPDVSGKILMGVGPPLLNLKERMSLGELTAADGRILPFELWEMDRCGCLMADPASKAVQENYQMKWAAAGREEVFTLKTAPNHCDWFRNRRVLLTKSQNNRLEWIRDWVAWHVRRHGADAVLFYDNQSSEYGEEEVLEMLAGMEGVKTAVVVPWDFKFGPTGVWGHRWDSDFCQHGILENARWRFLAEAASVLCCDVDELVVAPQGRSIFQICEESVAGGVVFDGRWVQACQEETRQEGAIHGTSALNSPRHRDHRHFLLSAPLCPDKWAVVPSRITEDSQWNVHAVDGHQLDRAPKGTGYRHFKGISTSWKYWRETSAPFNSEDHEYDSILAEAWKEEFRWEAQPWMAPEEISLMEILLKPGDRVLEFGAGSSSLWLAGRAALVHSVEHQREWVERLRSQAAANLNLHLAEPEFPHEGYSPAAPGQFAGYLAVPDKLATMFDFCLVDGRARIESAVRAAPWIRGDGWLLIHDWYRRERYIDRLAELLPFYEFREEMSLRATPQTMAVFRRKPSSMGASFLSDA